uniref:Capsid protein n=1 Tax=Torque teno Leptonychotes weddellii virus-1 TaxID=2012676 RepID=A0A1Z2RWH4_9VIRU|nr:ORF1 [Torque teno Leptonychotes weddellii virus 1]
MVFRKRRWRRPRRPRWRGRRKHLYKWRKRHWPHRRWRRRYNRPRTATVRYYPSRRRKRISVRGWEPLGNVCFNDIASSEATPYIDLDKSYLDPRQNSTSQTGKWSGTWGHHFFTFKNLLYRAQYYFNYWSSDWEGYDYISFRGGWIWIPRMPYFSWIFGIDRSIQSNPKDGGVENKYQNEKSWFHPGIFLNRPCSRLMISSVQQPNRSFFRKIRVTPPSAWEGNYRIDVGIDFLLFHWYWTICNMTSSFYDIYCQRKRQMTDENPDTCPQVPWFISDPEWEKVKAAAKNPIKDVYENITKNHYDPRSVWVDRKKYIKSDCVNTTQATSHVPSNFHNWGPFLPQNVILSGTTGNSLYFRYKLYFKVSGDTIYRRLPSKPCLNAVIPPAPGENQTGCPDFPSDTLFEGGAERPPSIYDILPGDLDSDGMLTERAYERITGSDRFRQPAELERRLPSKGTRKRVRFREPVGVCKRKRARKLLRLLLGGRGESGGGGPPPNPPPVREPLDLLLNFPK